MIYTPMTKKALSIAYQAHHGQVDHSGLPYIHHPLHLAETMTNELACTVALLHDVVEDTAVTLEDLAKEFPAEVIDAVRLLTHEEGVDYFDYVRAIRTNQTAAIKFGWKNMARIKENWYALDFLYLQNRPGFRAFRAYLGSVGFVNTYLDFFAPDAFDDRREYITSFYLQENDHLDREYPYLTEAEADRFVDDAAAEILARLEEIL